MIPVRAIKTDRGFVLLTRVGPHFSDRDAAQIAQRIGYHVGVNHGDVVCSLGRQTGTAIIRLNFRPERSAFTAPIPWAAPTVGARWDGTVTLGTTENGSPWVLDLNPRDTAVMLVAAQQQGKTVTEGLIAATTIAAGVPTTIVDPESGAVLGSLAPFCRAYLDEPGAAVADALEALIRELEPLPETNDIRHVLIIDETHTLSERAFRALDTIVRRLNKRGNRTVLADQDATKQSMPRTVSQLMRVRVGMPATEASGWYLFDAAWCRMHGIDLSTLPGPGHAFVRVRSGPPLRVRASLPGPGEWPTFIAAVTAHRDGCVLTADTDDPLGSPVDRDVVREPNPLVRPWFDLGSTLVRDVDRDVVHPEPRQSSLQEGGDGTREGVASHAESSFARPAAADRHTAPPGCDDDPTTCREIPDDPSGTPVWLIPTLDAFEVLGAGTHTTANIRAVIYGLTAGGAYTALVGTQRRPAPRTMARTLAWVADNPTDDGWIVDPDEFADVWHIRFTSPTEGPL